ncbi:MAG TPA: glutathione S-transferase [Solirubrobacteraceae bacterium]|jgi:glutathione S-transferase|nr:glutathione S-transferase [Solirubrobacteraceae bacterium]
MARSRPQLKLYMFPGSNSVLTGKLMLDHKGVDYKVVKLPPGLHAFIMLGLGFESMGVPAIRFGERRVQGTRSISRALDEIEPARPLFPSDPVARKAVEDAERWGEEFQNATRRMFYAMARRDRRAFTTFMISERALPMRIFLRAGAGIIIRLATGAHRATDDAAREDAGLLPERLDQIDAWIDAGVLGGAELNAADYQIGVNVALLMTSEDLAPLIAGRPAADLGRRVLPGQGTRLGRILPAEWLSAPAAPTVATPVAVPGPGVVAAAATGAGAAAGAGAATGAGATVVSGPVTDGPTAAFLRSVGIDEAKIAELVRR